MNLPNVSPVPMTTAQWHAACDVISKNGLRDFGPAYVQVATLRDGVLFLSTALAAFTILPSGAVFAD